jgi:hypothetical protein
VLVIGQTDQWLEAGDLGLVTVDRLAHLLPEGASHPDGT